MIKDQRGIELAIGQEVAYNRSGYIITGEIVGLGATIKIRPAERFIGKYEHLMYDPRTKDYTIPRKMKPSRVKNGYSTLVLRQPDGTLVI